MIIIIFDRIEQKYTGMSKGQQQVADFMRKHPEEVINSSSRELEKKIGVSAATIIRFVKSIGYSGMDEMRAYLVQQVQYKEQSIELQIGREDNTKSLEMKILQLYRDSVESLKETLDIAALERACLLLQNAKRIYLLGVGTSGLIAYDLYHRLNRYGKTAFFDMDAHMNLEFTQQSTKDDVIIAISYSGVTEEVVIGAEAAKKRNVPIISILSNKHSPLAKATDIQLLIPQTEHLVRLASMASRIHSTLVTDILFSEVVKEDLSNAKNTSLKTGEIVSKLKRS
ncbi:MurR/RpiR family transcriptional regulator [Pediococcus acidilactici]|uniref:MurR/RpiR family transcriptional regulator n=1 Tax=Pediococcus acidilactici TaxID=1254 RepID=UPI000B34BC9E|nr:MurR/RpiR family transcriptional regulator [Pediococcus acidilactici]QDJ22039.1 MurR/RpiR family transcriptional regulator [Pediococcus acidilactici]